MKEAITTYIGSLNFEHIEPRSSIANLMGKFFYRSKLTKPSRNRIVGVYDEIRLILNKFLSRNVQAQRESHHGSVSI